eukprot:6475730-Amphidinium_carterae.2
MPNCAGTPPLRVLNKSTANECYLSKQRGDHIASKTTRTKLENTSGVKHVNQIVLLPRQSKGAASSRDSRAL